MRLVLRLLSGRARAASRRGPDALSWNDFLAHGATPVDEPAHDDLAMIVGTGGTTGRPKGVELTGTNLETMTAITLMGYPFDGRPVYLALAPLTHAAGVLCFPVLALGGEVVVMRGPASGSSWTTCRPTGSRTRSCHPR